MIIYSETLVTKLIKLCFVSWYFVDCNVMGKGIAVHIFLNLQNTYLSSLQHLHSFLLHSRTIRSIHVIYWSKFIIFYSFDLFVYCMKWSNDIFVYCMKWSKDYILFVMLYNKRLWSWGFECVYFTRSQFPW